MFIFVILWALILQAKWKVISFYSIVWMHCPILTEENNLKSFLALKLLIFLFKNLRVQSSSGSGIKIWEASFLSRARSVSQIKLYLFGFRSFILFEITKASTEYFQFHSSHIFGSCFEKQWLMESKEAYGFYFWYKFCLVALTTPELKMCVSRRIYSYLSKVFLQLILHFRRNSL